MKKPKQPPRPAQEPQPDLPADPAQFWSPGDEDLWQLPPDLDSSPTLKRLGPIPLPKTTFPLMGFLATLYDQVATYAHEALEGRRS